jgi:uncharacterized protein YggE
MGYGWIFDCSYWLLKYYYMNARLTVILAIVVFSFAQPLVFPTIPDLSAAFAAATKSSSLPSPAGLATSPSSCNSYCEEDTIKVSGTAEVFAQPDTAQLNIRISAYANTTNEVIVILADKVTSVLNILSWNGLKSSNWETTQLSIFPNNSYVDNAVITYGQIATQSIFVKIPNVSADGASIGKVYDGLAGVNGIEIYGLIFDIADKTAILAQARTEAYKNAESRAKDYCGAAGVTLGNAITITDSFNLSPYTATSFLPRTSLGKVSSGSATTVTVGTIKVNYDLTAAFSFF